MRRPLRSLLSQRPAVPWTPWSVGGLWYHPLSAWSASHPSPPRVKDFQALRFTCTNLTRFMCLNEHWKLCLTKVISLLTNIAINTILERKNRNTSMCK